VALETTVSTKEPERLLAALAPYRPLEVVVETCPFWPWLYDLLVTLAGIQKLYLQSDTAALITEGDGSAVYFPHPPGV